MDPKRYVIAVALGDVDSDYPVLALVFDGLETNEFRYDFRIIKYLLWFCCCTCLIISSRLSAFRTSFFKFSLFIWKSLFSKVCNYFTFLASCNSRFNTSQLRSCSSRAFTGSFDETCKIAASVNFRSSSATLSKPLKIDVYSVRTIQPSRTEFPHLSPDCRIFRSLKNNRNIRLRFQKNPKFLGAYLSAWFRFA